MWLTTALAALTLTLPDKEYVPLVLVPALVLILGLPQTSQREVL